MQRKYEKVQERLPEVNRLRERLETMRKDRLSYKEAERQYELPLANAATTAEERFYKLKGTIKRQAEDCKILRLLSFGSKRPCLQHTLPHIRVTKYYQRLLQIKIQRVTDV